MSTASSSSRFKGRHRISGPAELLQAVPYLLGFQPRSSLVLVGLHDSALVVTARLDLADGDPRATVRHTVRAMARGGSTEVVAIVHDDAAVPDPRPATPLPWARLTEVVADEADDAGCRLVDALLVAGGRWWAYDCADPWCCPRTGRSMPGAPSGFAAAATFAGIAVLPDRDALAAQFDPGPGVAPTDLLPLIEREENEAVAAALAAGSHRRDRATKRAIFAVARAADVPGWDGLTDQDVVRFGVALASPAVRDPVWLAVDDDRLDGRELWRRLAGRLPAPYRAAPLFLAGWQAWRHGDGALARVAAERAIEADPKYSLADLLLAALTHGMDPRRVPRLRLSRPA